MSLYPEFMPMLNDKVRLCQAHFAMRDVECPHGCLEHCIVAEPRKVNDALRAAQSATGARWIPVSERLPEAKWAGGPKNQATVITDDVLVLHDFGVCEVLSYDHYEGSWHAAIGGGKVEDHPTHWMPLPSVRLDK